MWYDITYDMIIWYHRIKGWGRGKQKSLPNTNRRGSILQFSMIAIDPPTWRLQKSLKNEPEALSKTVNFSPSLSNPYGWVLRVPPRAPGFFLGQIQQEETRLWAEKRFESIKRFPPLIREKFRDREVAREIFRGCARNFATARNIPLYLDRFDRHFMYRYISTSRLNCSTRKYD